MTKELMDVEVNNGICEAVGCYAKATTKIKVKVGQRDCVLDLCVNCVNKFDQKEKALESVLQPLSNTNQSIQPSSVRREVHQEND